MVAPQNAEYCPKKNHLEPSGGDNSEPLSQVIIAYYDVYRLLIITRCEHLAQSARRQGGREAGAIMNYEFFPQVTRSFSQTDRTFVPLAGDAFLLEVGARPAG